MRIGRRGILTAGLAVAAVGALPDLGHAAGKTYYVSCKGKDTAAGTESAPWRSMQRVQEAFLSGQIGYGDTVRFRAGHSFYGQFDDLPSFQGSGRLTLGSYGRGSRPLILGYKVLNKASAWKKVGTNLWQIDLTDPGTHGGNKMSTSIDVGFLQVDGRMKYEKKASLDELRSDWQFHSEAKKKGDENHVPRYLTVYSTSNPTSRVGDLRVTVKGNLVRTKSNMTIQGLEFIGCGGHAIQVLDSTGVQVLDNTIRKIGGSYVYETTRYGNGVEVWIGSSDVQVSRNTISEVYDVATTMQGHQVLAEDDWGSPFRYGWRNVHITNNKITRCSQSFEIWAGPDDEHGLKDTGPNAGFISCSFARNSCSNAGQGWGYSARPDKYSAGVHFLSYSEPEDFHMELQVTENRFINAVNAYMYRQPDHRNEMVIDRNRIQLKAGQRLMNTAPESTPRPETIEQHKQWSEATGFDKNSKFIIR